MGHVWHGLGLGDLPILLDRRGRTSDCFAVHEPTVDNRVDGLHSTAGLPDVHGSDHLGELAIFQPWTVARRRRTSTFLPFIVSLTSICSHTNKVNLQKPSLDWWGRWGSNPRPRDYESPALTTELLPRVSRSGEPPIGRTAVGTPRAGSVPPPPGQDLDQRCPLTGRPGPGRTATTVGPSGGGRPKVG